MSKGKNLIRGIVCATWATVAAANHQDMILLAFAAAAALFLGILFYTCYRDFYRIPSRARLERAQAAQIPHQLPQTSKGSRRLFVPPPIK